MKAKLILSASALALMLSIAGEAMAGGPSGPPSDSCGVGAVARDFAEGGNGEDAGNAGGNENNETPGPGNTSRKGGNKDNVGTARDMAGGCDAPGHDDTPA